MRRIRLPKSMWIQTDLTTTAMVTATRMDRRFFWVEVKFLHILLLKVPGNVAAAFTEIEGEFFGG